MARWTRSWQRAAVAVAALLLWQLTAELGRWPHYLLPGPWGVADSLGRMLADGRLPHAALRSVARLIQGYLLSVFIGVPLGLALARKPFFRLALRPFVLGLQALPSICWLPLALLWFGLSEAAILFVVVMGSVMAIAIAAEDGVKAISPLLLQSAATLGVRGARLYAGVLIPGAMPGIVTGLKLGWSFAWRALLAAELLFVSGGLGQLLTAGRELLDVSQVLAVMGAIILLGYAMDRLVFRTLEVRVRRRWGLVASA